MSKVPRQPTDPPPSDGSTPEYRPSDRFWPYVDLPEEPSDEELALVDPDLRAILLGAASTQPFSVTIVFPPFDGPDFERALDLARGATEYRVTGSGAATRHRARFLSDEAIRLRSLYELVGTLECCEILVDDRPLPYARELWLPLMWFLIRR